MAEDSKLKNNQYKIDSNWFKGPKVHKDKFPKAFDYLQEKGHGQCIVLTKGEFAVNHFDWRHFTIGLLAEFTARLTIFYTDYKSKGKNDIDIVKIPDVDQKVLQDAICELEKAVNELQRSLFLIILSVIEW